MACGVFNIAKGRGNEFVDRVANNDPANAALIVVLLRNSVADATLEDFDDLAAILADPGVDEANFRSIRPSRRMSPSTSRRRRLSR